MVEYMNEKIELLKAAKKIYDDPNRQYYRSGICGIIIGLIHPNINEDIINDILTDIFHSWPKFSGSYTYPIPYPGYDNPREAYNKTSYEYFWDPNHPYGSNRIDLLEYIIKELAKELRNAI